MGLGWLFSGPEVSLSYPLQVDGVPKEEFTQAYPTFVDHIAYNEREKAIWFMAFGLMSFLVGTGISSLRDGAFPSWFGWVCVVFGAGLLTPIHSLFEGLAGKWIVVESI